MISWSDGFEPSCPRCGDLLIPGSHVCPACFALVTVTAKRAPRDWRRPVEKSVDTVDDAARLTEKGPRTLMPLNDVAPNVALPAKPEECGNCQSDDSVYWNPTGGWSCSSCGASDYEEAAE